MRKLFLLVFTFSLSVFCSNLFAQSTPTVTGTYCPGATTVNGISAEADGAAIRVFIGINPAGITLVASGNWSITVPSLSAGDVITAEDDASGLVSAPVVVDPAPTLNLSVGVSTNPICENTSTNITVAFSELGFLYQLRNDADDSNVGSAVAGTGGTINLPTGNITATTAYNVYATGVAPSNCNGELTTVQTVTVNATPAASAGGSQTICQGAAAVVSGATSSNGTILWTHDGAGSITNATTLTPTYTSAGGDAGNTVTLTMTVSNAPCTAATATYAVVVEGSPTASAGGSQTICQGGTAVVSGATSSNGTILWTHDGAGSITNATTLTPTYTSAAGDAGNTVTLTMTVSNGVCTNATATYSVVVRGIPTASAGGSQTICQGGTAVVSGASSSNGTILWTHDGAGSITAGATSLTPTYTSAAGDAGSTVILTMTVSNGVCTNATATYSVVVRGIPTASAGGSQTICQGGTAVVSGASSSNGTILWTHDGAGSITNATTLTPTYTSAAGDVGNTVTLTMTVSNGVCSNATAIYSVTVEAPPTASAGGSQTICQGGTAVVSGATSSNGTILWTDDGAGSITSGATTLTPTYTSAAGDAGHTVILTMTVSNGVCTNATATYSVVVRGIPTASAGGSQTICQGGTAVVSGASSSNGTILWTHDGAGSITAGATSLTPTYTSAAGDAGSTVTLTMTVSNGICTNATANYSVVVKATPTSSAGGSQTICQGGTAVVSGATSSNGTILWTDDGAGSITSGATTLTPTYTSAAGDAGHTVTLTMTVSNAPCTAATATYSVIVQGAPTASAGGSQTICQGGTAVVSGATSSNGTILWTDDGAGSITSGATTLTPTYTSAAGDAGHTVILTMTVSNSICTAATATYSVIVKATPAPAADAGSPQTGVNMCGLTTTTLAGNAATVGTGLWTIVGGSGGSFGNALNPASTFTGTAGTTYVLQWAISNAPCASSMDNVTISFWQSPTAANAGADQVGASMCGVTTTTLTANTPSAGTGSWSIYSGGSGSFGNSSSPSSTFTGTAGSTYVLRWTISNPPCTSFDDVTVTYWQNPTVANAGSDQVICSSNTTLAGNVPSIGSGLWTKVSGSGTITSPGSYNSGVTGLTAGTSVFKWTITNGACSSSDNMSIDNGTVPSVDAGSDQTLCNATTATLAGNTPGSGTAGSWSVTVGGASVTSVSDPNSGVTNLSVGTNTFRWTITDAGCVASDDVTIIVNTPPTAANAGANQTVCTSTATLSGNNPSSGTGTWTKISGSGTITTPGSHNSGITGLTAGTSVFRWTTANPPCTPSSDDVNIIVNGALTTANAGTDQTLCNVTTATLAGNNPSSGTGAWTVIAGGGTVNSSSSYNSGVSNLSVGTNTFRWTISNAPCTPSTDDVTIIVNALPTVANAGSDQTLCNVTTGTLAGNNATSGTGTWTVIAGGGTVDVPSSYNSTLSNLSTGVNTFRWTISNAPCTSSADDVTILVNTTPSIANAGSDQTLCNVTTGTLAGNNPSAGTGMWSVISGGGTVNSPSTYNSTVSNLAVGVNTFRWTISNAPCTPSSDDVIINVSASPTAPNAGPDQTLCNSTTATLAGNTPVTGSGVWTKVSGSGVITTPGSSGSGVTGLTVGASSIFRWTITNGACAIFDDVTISISVPPTTPNAGPNQTLCNATTTTLAGNTPTTGTGVWTKVSGSGAITTPGNPGSGVTGLTVGASSTFRWTITNGVCTASDDVIITSSAPATVANAGIDQTICSSNATLSGNSPSAGSGLWTKVSGGGTVTITSPGSFTTTVSGLVAGTSVFRWTITNGACSSFDNVSIVNGNVPAINAGPDQTLCNTTTSTLAGNTPASGAGQWSVITGGATVTSLSNPASGVTNLSAGINTFRWTITDGGCVATDDIIVMVNSSPTTANAGADQTGASMCGITTTTLTATPATVGTGQWSIISGAGGSLGNVLSPASTFSGTAGTAYVLRWTVSNPPCTSSLDDVTITFRQNPTTANAGIDQNGAAMCGLTTTTLTANGPSVGSGQWSIVSGSGGTFGSNTNPASSFNGTTGTTYVLRWTISNSPCTASADDVTVSFWRTPTVANAGADQTVCSGSATLAGNNPVIGTGLWTKVSGTGTVTTPGSPTSGITGLTSGTSVFRWTIKNDSCTSFDNVSITNGSIPPVNAGPDQSLCGGTTATLAGSTPASGTTGSWSILAGSASVTTSSSPTSGVSNLSLGVNTFRWTITNGTCTTSDDITINVSATPTSANAGTDQIGASMCGLTSTTLAGNTPVTGTGQWSVVSGAGGSFVNDKSPTSVFNGTSGISYVLRWTISNGSCIPSSDDMTVIFWQAPTTANAGPDQTSLSSAATLSGNVPVIGTGKWTLVAGTGSVTATSNPGSGVTGLSPGKNTFRWTISSPPCPDSFDDVIITATLNNLAPDAKNDTVILPEDSFASINVQLNDKDPNLDLLTTSIVKGPANGMAVLNGNKIDYFPSKDFNGKDTIVYAVCDTASISLCDTAIVFITVTPVNDRPVVKDTSIVTSENHSVKVCTPVNDVDGGQSFTFSSCKEPVNGTYITAPITGNKFCITYIPTSNYHGSDSLCMVICDNGSPSLCDTVYIFIKITKEIPVVLNAPQGFSPNGDGVNEFFVISGIEKYPGNHILIFNQWGNLVYEKSPYENDWGGTNEGKGSSGHLLPSGTYYFVLDLGDGSAPVKKYIYLSR